MTFVRVMPDLHQPEVQADHSLKIQWGYKKGQFENEIFPSSVDLQLDFKIYKTATALESLGEVVLPASVVAKYAGAGSLLNVSVVFHFKGGGNDVLPPSDSADAKNVATKPWAPGVVAPPKVDVPPPKVDMPPPTDPRAIRVVAGAKLSDASSQLVATSWEEGRIDVFVAGRDRPGVQNNGGLAHTWHENGFHKFETIFGDYPAAYGGVTSLNPGAVSTWGKGRMDIFVGVPNSVENEIFHGWYDDRWGAWESLGAPQVGNTSNFGTAATSWARGRIDVIATTGSRAFHNWFEKGWRGWEDLSPWLGSDVGVGKIGMATPGVGAFDLYCFGASRAELESGAQSNFMFAAGYRSGTQSPWRPWVPINVPGMSMADLDFSTPPKPVLRHVRFHKIEGVVLEPRYDVFVKFRNGMLCRLYQVGDGVWTISPVAAPPVGVEFNGGFDAVSWVEGRFDVFVWGSDGRVYHYWSNDAGVSFTGPEVLPQ